MAHQPDTVPCGDAGQGEHGAEGRSAPELKPKREQGNPATLLERLLRDSGAVLVSNNKHRKHRLPNGMVFVSSNTPAGGKRGQLNELSRLRRMVRDGAEGQGGTGAAKEAAKR